jgi:tetratricopeptide (TPR) repeat protein
MIYQYKGDYDAALKQYEKSMEIKGEIEDIPGAALSMHQMGNLYFLKNEFETALEYFIQAFLVFTKIGSPYAKQSENNIAETREKLSEEQFDAILKKFNLKLETLAGDPNKQLFDLLAVVTSQAFSVKEKSSQEKEKVAAQIYEIIDQLPDDKPEIQGIKSYFQMLLAVVNGEEVQTYMEKIPEELKEMFEKIQEEKKGSESVNQ